jgi:hypothetical protein
MARIAVSLLNLNRFFLEFKLDRFKMLVAESVGQTGENCFASISLYSEGTTEMLIQLPTFLHRANRDGTFNSICTICFHTIATGIHTDSLAGAERE